ncbi:hypothetical protein WMF38_57640 [Sorangium sp. So ce118]
MSTSAHEVAEHHLTMVRLFTELHRRYPGASRCMVNEQEVFVAYRGGVKHDHISVIGDALMPCDRVEADGAWVPVVDSAWDKRSTIGALKYLKEKHPEAYAGLIEWLVRG